MRPIPTFAAIVFAAGLIFGFAAQAAPALYALEAEGSSVGFETDFGPDRITGRMPVSRADLTLDFQTIANCKVAVTLDVSSAQASFPFAAQAMKGPKVLDASAYPTITFQSTKVRAAGNGATVEGRITIRGVTQPIVLNARFWRQAGSEAEDLSHLTIRLTGAVKRSLFGATGWSDMVGDEVRLDILARIAKVD
jgi:polyisoprenoid-binding protein YceI